MYEYFVRTSFFMYMYLEKSCRNDVSYEKFVRKLLMKLTVGESVGGEDGEEK